MHVRYRNEVLVRGTLLLKDKKTVWVPWGTISRLLTEQSPLVNRPCLTCLDDGVTWGQTLCLSICATAPVPGREADCFCASPGSTACCRSSPDRLRWAHPAALGFLRWHPIEVLVKLKISVPSDQSSAFSIPKLACNVQLKLAVSSSAPPTQWHFLHKDEDVAHFFYLSFTTMYRQQHRIKKLFV